MAGLLSDALPVVHGSLVLRGVNLSAVHNAQIHLRDGRNVGGAVDIQLILIGNLIRRNCRCDNGEDDQKQQNISCHNGRLILPEAKHCVSKEAAELGLDLLIVQPGIHLHEFKLFT